MILLLLVCVLVLVAAAFQQARHGNGKWNGMMGLWQPLDAPGRWKPIEHERRRGFEEEAGVVGQPAWGIGGKDGDGRVQASDRWLLHETRAGLGVCRRQPRQRWWCWLLFRTSPLAQGDPSML